MLKRNVLANSLSGFWNIFLNLAMIPIQIRILGPEAYGLVGFMTSIQVALTVFDFGVSVTMIREIASDTSAERQLSRELIQIGSSLYTLVGFVVATALFLGADWIANQWLNSETLTPQYIAGAIRLMAFIVFSNWLISVYISILSGLQRLDIVSLLRVITRTTILVGGVIVLFLTHDFYAFLVWTAASSVGTLIAHMGFIQRLFPKLSFKPYLSLPALRRFWRGVFELNVVTLITIVCLQADKFFISILMPLSSLGYYNAAYSLAYGLASIQQFVTAAMLPALASDYSQGQQEMLITRYSKFIQVLLYIVGVFTFVFVFFGYDFLLLWAGVETAHKGSGALAILALGFLLNTLNAAYYTLAIATGNIRLLLFVNVTVLFVYLPTIYGLISWTGLEGAALAWVLINVYNLFILIPYLHKRVLHAGILAWLGKNVAPFISLGIIFWLGSRLIPNQPLSNISSWFVCIICIVAYLGVGYFFLDRAMRVSTLRAVRNLLSRWSFA